MQVDEDGADLRQLDLETLPIGGLERLLQLVPRDADRGDLDGEEMALPLELHLGAVEDGDLLDGDALALQRLPPVGDLRFEHVADDALFERRERLVDGAHEIVPEIGDEAAEGVGKARARRLNCSLFVRALRETAARRSDRHE